MSTLFIRLPSKAAADNTPHWITLSCPFALATGAAIEREGAAPLADLAPIIARAQRVVLLLAASDVTLLQVRVPPLSPARLKAALPNLLEDQLMSDPAESVFVAGPSVNGLRTVAVAQRGWLDILSHTLLAYGARNLSAIPAQFCLPHEEGVVTAAASAHAGDIDLTVRLSESGGIGLPIFPDDAAEEPREVVQTLCAVVPTAPITLYVAQEKVPAYEHVVGQILALDQRITVYADNWSRWIAGAGQQSMNLFNALGGAGGAVLDWRPWRWPAILLLLVLLVNAIGLNIDWLRKKREAETLRNVMLQTYKVAYPGDTVVRDPVLQMRQKIVAAQRDSGQPATDDFVVLTASFGAAWELAAGGRPAAGMIAGLDYRDKSLFLRIKPGSVLPVEPLKAALAQRNFAMAPAGSNLWQIRSVK